MNPSLPFNSPAHALSWLKRVNLADAVIAPRFPDRYPKVNLTPPRHGVTDKDMIVTYKDAIVCLGATHSFTMTYRD